MEGTIISSFTLWRESKDDRRLTIRIEYSPHPLKKKLYRDPEKKTIAATHFIISLAQFSIFPSRSIADRDLLRSG